MATTVDTLITRYQVRDEYTNAVSRMASSTQRFGAGVAQAGGAIAALAGVNGLVDVAQQAIKASADFEQLQVTLEVLTGSAEKARQKLEFIRQLALPSTFTFSELAEAGTMLEGFGVNLERVLPLLAKLGAAFPNKDIREAVSLFGRLAQGDFPDIELLSGFGLNKSQFRSQGVAFDSDGRLLSSARETMDALERIINQKYGSILDRISGTTNAKLATLRDKWEQTMRKVGDTLVKLLLPALEKLGQILDSLGNTGNLDKFFKTIAVRAVQMALVINGVVASVLFATGLLRLAFKDYLGGTLSIIKSLTLFAAGFAAMDKAPGFINRLFSSRISGGGGTEVPDGSNTPFLSGLGGAESAQMETARNTAQIAANTDKMLDLRRFVVGGGPLAQIGVTPAELGGRRGGGRTITVDAGGKKLNAALQDIVIQVLDALERERPRGLARG